MNIRQSIVNELTTAFKEISIDNGYLTDVAAADVYHWNISGHEEKDNLEVINVKDRRIRYEDGDHILEIEIILGAIKTSLFEDGDTEQQKLAKIHQFISNRTLDIYKCLNSKWSTWREKYGYWRYEVKEEDLIITQEKYKVSECDILLEITYKSEEKYEPELRNFQ